MFKIGQEVSVYDREGMKQRKTVVDIKTLASALSDTPAYVLLFEDKSWAFSWNVWP